MSDTTFIPTLIINELTQAEYDALETIDENQVYVITDQSDYYTIAQITALLEPFNAVLNDISTEANPGTIPRCNSGGKLPNGFISMDSVAVNITPDYANAATFTPETTGTAAGDRGWLVGTATGDSADIVVGGVSLGATVQIMVSSTDVVSGTWDSVSLKIIPFSGN